MRAYNKRLKHEAEIVLLDYSSKIAKLKEPNSNPTFIYKEDLDNIEVLEYTGVTIEDKKIHVGDKLTDGNRHYIVSKIPGGYYPFMQPVKIDFKRVDDGM